MRERERERERERDLFEGEEYEHIRTLMNGMHKHEWVFTVFPTFNLQHFSSTKCVTSITTISTTTRVKYNMLVYLKMGAKNDNSLKTILNWPCFKLELFTAIVVKS